MMAGAAVSRASCCLPSAYYVSPVAQHAKSYSGQGKQSFSSAFLPQPTQWALSSSCQRSAVRAPGRSNYSTGVRAGPSGRGQMLVFVPPHPLIKHWVAVLRSTGTPPAMFRSALAELGRCLMYEAIRDWLEMVEGQVETPCGVADVAFINPTEPVKVVPILRAGLVLVEHAQTLLPSMQTYHIGYVRNEYSLRPEMYLNKLPTTFPPNSRVLIADPMLATGGTICAAIEEVRRRGADTSLIRVIAAVAAPPALKILGERYPGLKVYVGIIDSELNDKGFIVPGLGDAGDRSFNT